MVNYMGRVDLSIHEIKGLEGDIVQVRNRTYIEVADTCFEGDEGCYRHGVECATG